MLQTICSYIVTVLITGIITYFAQRQRYKQANMLQHNDHEHEEILQHMEQEHKEQLQEHKIMLERNFEEITNFIRMDGLKEIFNFFKDNSKPQKLLDYLEKLSNMETDFEKLEGSLVTMMGMVNARLFNPVTGHIHAGIESNPTFTTRLKEQRDSKEYLRDHWIGIEDVQRILRYEKSIFIESGSTLAYCMLSILDNITTCRESSDPLKVCTNNVAIYMMLLFQKQFEPVLLPGKPDNPYAATFGDIDQAGKHNNDIRNFLEDHNVNVLFTTASYVDIDYGPHVSSIQNHAMKRILNDYANDKNCTNIFVIAAEKINKDIQEETIEERCKLIFDPNGTENILDNINVLKNAGNAWREHLLNHKTMIITGSNEERCRDKIDSLADKYSMGRFEMQSNDNDKGVFYKLQHN